MKYSWVITFLLLSVSGATVFGDEIWVSNEKSDTISVIDIDKLEVVREYDVGERPRGIVFSNDYKHLYICASDSDAVQVMDVETGEILHDLPSGEDPEQFALHPNNRLLYIANEDDAITTVVDTNTKRVIAQINVGVEPEGMAVSPDGKVSITTSETTNMAHWIDTETNTIFANTLVDARPRHAEYTDDGKHLWVSSEIGGTVTVFNTEDQSEITKINFEIAGVHRDKIQPVGVELNEDNSLAFVALGPANHIAVVDTSGDVSVVDLERLEAIKAIKVGRFPWGAAARPTN